MDVGYFTASADYAVAKIKEIELIEPDASDPVPCMFKVRSVGQSPNGVERTVLAYLDGNPSITIALPAALISFNEVGVWSNCRVHWGEAWSKNGTDMMQKSQSKHLDSSSASYDKWAKYRSEGEIRFDTTWKWGAGKDLFDPTRSQVGAAPASGNYADAFEQYLPEGTLEWPDFLSQYQVFKDHAIATGRYYSTDAAGNVYRDGVEDADHKVDFGAEFDIPDRGDGTYDFAFIDTVDGQPPAVDGSNLATITVAGGSFGLKGFYWLGAHYEGTGVGDPLAVDYAKDPDGNANTLSKVRLDGVLYSAGTVAMGGNDGIYGSVVAEHGYAGGGTPDIYYNVELENGLPLSNGNVGSTFRVVMQTNY